MGKQKDACPPYMTTWLAERVYAQKGGEEGGEAPHSHAGGSSHAAEDDGVIDADFEEVKK